MKTSRYLVGITASLATMFCGCVPDTVREYQALRDACDLEDGEVFPIAFGTEGSLVDISKDCSASLGGVVGLDWDAFDAQPGSVSDTETTTEMIIGGLFLFVGSDLGTLSEFDDVLADDELLHEPWEAWKDDRGAGVDGSSGIFWVDWLGQAVNAVVPGDGPDTEAMRFHEGTVAVSSAPNGDDVVDLLEYPVYIAGLFVHEAGHAGGYSHVTCAYGDPGCDADSRGTWGAQARFIERWIDMNAQNVSESDCAAALWAGRESCEHINDIEADSVCRQFATVTCE